MKSYFIDQNILFNHTMLNANFGSNVYNFEPKSIFSFVGRYGDAPPTFPHVQKNEVTDMKILHFISEHPPLTRKELLLFHWILTCLMLDFLGQRFLMRGLNIFRAKQAVTITEFSQSDLASVIYVGVFLNPPATNPHLFGLHDLGIKPQEFAVAIMQSYVKEVEAFNENLEKDAIFI